MLEYVQVHSLKRGLFAKASLEIGNMRAHTPKAFFRTYKYGLLWVYVINGLVTRPNEKKAVTTAQKGATQVHASQTQHQVVHRQ